LDPVLMEWLNLVVRWFHVIAGIMWIGSSLFFIWLENSLIKPQDAQPGDIGEVFMVHGGGYYHVVKRELAGTLPDPLHWFKWEAYMTWLSGFSLLAVVYYLGGKAFLVDPAIADISTGTAVAVGIGSLVVSWLFYDRLWASPMAEKHDQVATGLTAAYVLGAVYALTHVLSGRAAYIHVGALMGTIMAGNVFFRIIPGQKVMVAAAAAGQAFAASPSKRAKARSRHNNYFTFPVIFIMISNHFPTTFGHQWNWLILAVLMIGSAVIKHFMNINEHFGYLVPRTLATAGVAAVALYLITASPKPTDDPTVASLHAGASSPVAFGEAQAIIQQRCVQCHAAKPTDDTFTVAPSGIQLDSPEKIKALVERIKVRAVDTKTMPFANKTGITEVERATLGRWIAAGARMD
jgi:uncharacterized membrane protein